MQATLTRSASRVPVETQVKRVPRKRSSLGERAPFFQKEEVLDRVKSPEGRHMIQIPKGSMPSRARAECRKRLASLAKKSNSNHDMVKPIAEGRKQIRLTREERAVVEGICRAEGISANTLFRRCLRVALDLPFAGFGEMDRSLADDAPWEWSD